MRLRLLMLTALLAVGAVPAFATNTTTPAAPTTPTQTQSQSDLQFQNQLTNQSVSNRNSNSNHNANSNRNSATGGAAAANGGSVGNVSVGSGNTYREPVSTAYARAPDSANHCGGSGAGIGVQGMGFGGSLSAGGDMDDECRDVRFGNFETAGQKIAWSERCYERKGIFTSIGNALFGSTKDFKAATAAAGYRCPNDAAAAPQPVAQPVSYEQPKLPDWCEHLSSVAEKRLYAGPCQLGGDTQVPRH